MASHKVLGEEAHAIGLSRGFSLSGGAPRVSADAFDDRRALLLTRVLRGVPHVVSGRRLRFDVAAVGVPRPTTGVVLDCDEATCLVDKSVSAVE